MYTSTHKNEKVWMNTNVMRFSKYVKLDDVLKICACYFIAKKDKSVSFRLN